jgi:hypothetical protein
MEESYYVMTFGSTHLAMKFEEVIDKAELPGELIPLPREISADCGLAGKFAEENLEAVKELCEEENIDFTAIYQMKEFTN